MDYIVVEGLKQHLFGLSLRLLSLTLWLSGHSLLRTQFLLFARLVHKVHFPGPFIGGHLNGDGISREISFAVGDEGLLQRLDLRL